ncbi:Zinc finger protein 555 [Papilio machaon]|uniref:Zinc finger protein 555 n=1 Tax=Papilio machaon TaxID=76193 RepID=A0A0N1IAA4_PAPMA|nr:Zinc finger protein 555 [Papilio machaon]
MEDLCSTCLCVGRNLFFIGETGFYNIFHQILNEIQVYDTSLCVRVCWECRAALHRFQMFKSQVQRSYTQLLHVQVQNGSSKLFLAKEPKLKIQQVVNINYPEIIVKEESDDDIPIDKLKSEATDEMHCEPETFVRDLNVTHTKESNKKKNKTRLKKKIKKKKDKIKVDEISDSENWPDLNTEDTLREEENLLEDEIVNVCDTEIQREVNLEELDVKDIPGEVGDVGEVGGEVRAPRRAPRSRERLPERPQCVECGKMFSSKKTYRYHLNVLHKGQNRYPCPRCGKVYQWKSNLGRHMRSHKARDSGELHCSPCDKLFASVATYRQHLRVSRRHVPETDFSFTCDECGKKFVSKTRLRDHIDWEHLHNIKFRCHLCNKNVHRDKDARHNLCHVCGKSYQNAAKLKYHIVAMHTSETPYRCERCGAAFGWYSSLYRHVREVHYKMKVQPKKTKKGKKNDITPHILPQTMPT